MSDLKFPLYFFHAMLMFILFKMLIHAFFYILASKKGELLLFRKNILLNGDNYYQICTNII